MIALEKKVAEMTGKESALFVTSGTQGNAVSIAAHCQRGDEIIIGDKSHIYLYEAGGPGNVLIILNSILQSCITDGLCSCFMGRTYLHYTK